MPVPFSVAVLSDPFIPGLLLCYPSLMFLEAFLLLSQFIYASVHSFSFKKYNKLSCALQR